MARVHYRDPDTGVWVPVGTVGPVGPSAVSADVGNQAVLGTDDLIFVPAPPEPVLDHGGLTGLGDDDHPHYLNQTRGDARYTQPSAVAPAALTPDIAAAVGVATAAARSDHVHNVPAAVAVALGAANAEGTSGSFARADHVHIYPTAANVGAAAATHSHVEGDLPATLATDTEVATAVTNHTSGQPHSALSITAPAALTPDIVAAVGVGTTTARADHVHNVPAAAPVANLTAATANAEGTGSSFARNDHSHAITANVSPSGLGVTAVGTNAALARADHVHAMPTASEIPSNATGDVTGITVQEAIAELAAEKAAVTSVTPTALTPDIAGAVGISALAARGDHAHNVPAAAPTTNLTATTTNSEGAGLSFARNDHSHAITTAAPVALGAANAVGTAASLARSDHVHIYPTAANVGAAAASHSHVEGDLPATLATDTEVATAVTNHAAAADPHTGYQKESEKGAINGYASLGADGLVPLTQLPEISSGDEVLIQDIAPASQVGLDLWVDSDAVGIDDWASLTYVDAQDALLSTDILGKVSKAGDTISGPIVVNNSLSVAGNVTVSGASVTEQHGAAGAGALTAFNVVATGVNIRGADPIHVGTAASNAAVRIENVAAPINAGDVANKAYADSKIVAAAVRPTNTIGVTAPMIWIPTT